MDDNLSALFLLQIYKFPHTKNRQRQLTYDGL